LGDAVARLRGGLDGILNAAGGRVGRGFADLRTVDKASDPLRALVSFVVAKETVETTKAGRFILQTGMVDLTRRRKDAK
jgi:hypothetical protein